MKTAVHLSYHKMGSLRAPFGIAAHSPWLATWIRTLRVPYPRVGSLTPLPTVVVEQCNQEVHMGRLRTQMIRATFVPKAEIRLIRRQGKTYVERRLGLQCCRS